MKKTNMLILLGFLSLSVLGSAKTQQSFEGKNYSIEMTKEKSELISESNSGNAEENGRQEKNLFGKKRKKVDENTQTNGKSGKKSLWNKIVNRKKSDKNEEWKLVWSDEFNGDKLDLSKWSYWENDYPSKNGNFVDENGNLVDQYGFKAKQYYLRDNVKVKDGNLVIEVKKENNKTVKIDGVDRKILYSSGAVHTKDKYDVKYGKIEMRAAMPKGIGVWPAFWTWPSDYAIRKIGDPAALEEIDIVEISGDNLREVTGTIHALKANSQYASFVGNDLTIKKNEDLSNFNTYAVEWNEKEIKWFFNGRNYKTVTMKEVAKQTDNTFKLPHYLIINVALKNTTGSDGDVDFPTEMKVDYVRVYKKDK